MTNFNGSLHQCISFEIIIFRKAVKAAIFLLPLLGITHMLETFVSPGFSLVFLIDNVQIDRIFIYFQTLLRSHYLHFTVRSRIFWSPFKDFSVPYSTVFSILKLVFVYRHEFFLFAVRKILLTAFVCSRYVT